MGDFILNKVNLRHAQVKGRLGFVPSPKTRMTSCAR